MDNINFECGYFQFKVLTWMNIIEDFMKRNDPTRDAWVSTISHRQIQECCCLPISDKLNIIDFIFSHIIWAVDFQINTREQEMFVFSSSIPLKLIDISWMIMIWYSISSINLTITIFLAVIRISSILFLLLCQPTNSLPLGL